MFIKIITVPVINLIRFINICFENDIRRWIVNIQELDVVCFGFVAYKSLQFS